MGMNSIKNDMNIEVLRDTTDADAAAKGRRRMGEMLQSTQGQMISKFNPNEQSRNSENAIPDSSYGDD